MKNYNNFPGFPVDTAVSGSKKGGVRGTVGSLKN